MLTLSGTSFKMAIEGLFFSPLFTANAQPQSLQSALIIGKGLGLHLKLRSTVFDRVSLLSMSICLKWRACIRFQFSFLWLGTELKIEK